MKHWWTYEFLGALLIIMSVLVFSYPIQSYAGLIFYFAAAFVVSGITRIFFAFSNKNRLHYSGLYLLGGFIDLVVGLYLISRPAIAALALPYYVGFYLMMGSIAAIAKSRDMKTIGVRNYKEMTLVGVVALVLSVFILINPALGIITAITSTGLCFFAMGIFYFILGSRLHKFNLEHGAVRERVA